MWGMLQLQAVPFLCLMGTSQEFSVLANASNSNAARLLNVSDLVASQALNSPFPYEFPDFARNSADAFPMADCNGVKLEEATIDDLQAAMRDGQLTSVAITICYLQRIYQTDKYIKYASELLCNQIHGTDLKLFQVH